MFTRRKLMATGLATPVLASLLASRATASAAEPPKPPSVDELLKDAEVLDVALSPDGSRAGILIQHVKDGKREAWIQFEDLINLGKAPPKVTNLGEATVRQIEWANEERLLVWVDVSKGPDGKPTGLDYYGEFIKIPVRRVLAINADGTQPVILFSNQTSIIHRLFDLSRVVDTMQSDPRNILMQLWDNVRGTEALYRVDVYTGAAVLTERGGSNTDGWFTQDGVPVIRYDSNIRGTVVSVYVRAPGETDWKLFRKVRRNELEQLSELQFVAPTTDAGVLLMLALDEGADMPSVRRFDTRTMKVGDVFAKADDHPITGVFVDEAYNPISVSVNDDLGAHRFLDRKLAAHYQGVKTYFKNELQVRPYDISKDHKRIIFHVSGPRQPGAFWLYEVDRANLELLGEQKPWLTQARLAPMKALDVKTRDGAKITAYLTTPIGEAKGPLPLVVVPHGGPELRDQLDFDLFAQTFAARGWLVLQPNFRGSGGYGRAFADQGRRHWGDRMQEDIEDCVAQVIASGVVDPKRIAICGASYGGYAALMGAVRKPDLYKAVVSIAGDADLVETLAFSRSEDGDDSSAYAYWRASIGDPKADRAMLEAASPALHAAAIQAPVLLIHGTEDKIVTPKQSRIMNKALKAAGKPCELIEIKGAAHRNWSDDNFRLMLTKSADHIAKAFA